MKNLTQLSLFILSVFLLMACDKEVILPNDKIPTAIKTYISTHFTTTSIRKAIEEKNESERYEIYLENGIVLEFNKDNEIVDIDGNGNKLPDSVIPPKILSYVNDHSSNNFIVGWEKKMNTQEVQLNNQKVLIFSLSGDFQSIGD